MRGLMAPVLEQATRSLPASSSSRTELFNVPASLPETACPRPTCRLSRLGWIAPAWPRQHGGMGLPADKLIAYIEESEAWGVARPPDQGW